jgi:large subunit ribosomal protein L10
MVSEKKTRILKEVKKQMKEYPVIGILNMHKLPGRQLHEIRHKLIGKAVIRMVKKRLIKLAIKDAKLPGIEKLDEFVEGEAALLLSSENPFKLAQVISASKSKAPAKAGDKAPYDLMVPGGPTSLMAGPVIGELQRVKIPAAVEDGKIAIKKDTVVAKAGDTITADLAGILAKLGIEPMEIGLDLVAVWEQGYLYPKDLLFIPADKYIDDLKRAAGQAFNMTLNVGYLTPYNVELLLAKGHNEAKSLATEMGFLTKDTLRPLLAKADAQANILKSKIKEPAPEKPAEAESKPEEKKAEEPNKEEPKAEEKPKEEANPDKEKEKA